MHRALVVVPWPSPSLDASCQVFHSLAERWHQFCKPGRHENSRKNQGTAVNVPLLPQVALNRSVPLPARLGALQALAALSAAHGRSLASVAPESLALGVKHTAR